MSKLCWARWDLELWKKVSVPETMVYAAKGRGQGESSAVHRGWRR